MTGFSAVRLPSGTASQSVSTILSLDPPLLLLLSGPADPPLLEDYCCSQLPRDQVLTSDIVANDVAFPVFKRNQIKCRHHESHQIYGFILNYILRICPFVDLVM